MSPEEASAWIGEWPPVLSGSFVPVFLSRFGDWFIRRPNGKTELFDVLEGRIVHLADTPAEFDEMVADVSWQEDHLLSWLVYELHQAGQIAHKRQCYGFAPHPAAGGRISKEHTMIFDNAVWQSICSQTLFSTD